MIVIPGKRQYDTGMDAAVILIFTTTVNSREETRGIGLWMQQHAGIIRWNIDFSDEERILKIVASTDIGHEVTHLFTRLGFTANLMAVYYAPPV